MSLFSIKNSSQKECLLRSFMQRPLRIISGEVFEISILRRLSHNSRFFCHFKAKLEIQREKMIIHSFEFLLFTLFRMETTKIGTGTVDTSARRELIAHPKPIVSGTGTKKAL